MRLARALPLTADLDPELAAEVIRAGALVYMTPQGDALMTLRGAPKGRVGWGWMGTKYHDAALQAQVLRRVGERGWTATLSLGYEDCSRAEVVYHADVYRSEEFGFWDGRYGIRETGARSHDPNTALLTAYYAAVCAEAGLEREDTAHTCWTEPDALSPRVGDWLRRAVFAAAPALASLPASPSPEAVCAAVCAGLPGSPAPEDT